MKENLQAVFLEETAAIELSGNCGADGKETPIERLAGLFFFVLCPVSSDQADGPWGGFLRRIFTTPISNAMPRITTPMIAISNMATPTVKSAHATPIMMSTNPMR